MSIQRYLLITILSIVTLASFSAALQGYKASREKLTSIFDKELKSFAIALAHSPLAEGKTVASFESIFAYQVFSHGQLRVKSDNAPVTMISTHSTGYQNSSFLGTRWRLFIYDEHNVRVIVAQPVEQRIASVEQVLLDAILPIVYAIPIIGLLVFFAINRSLKPLSSLSTQLKQKNADDLTPVQVIDNSLELKPIELTINHLLKRLGGSFEREKRLSGDAAHELRTPISVLKLNAHNLSIAFENNSIDQHHIDELNRNTVRMAHVIEQIITLNRTSPENFEAKKVRIDLRALLQQVISNNYDAVEQNQQTISLNCHQMSIDGDKFSLETLFDNLIKNANKYSGVNTDIVITVVDHHSTVEILVEDSGVGISKELISDAFQRFYRVKQHPQTGSGLGLSIVKHIVELHQGNVELSESPLGGLRVSIVLPIVLSKAMNNE